MIFYDFLNMCGFFFSSVFFGFRFGFEDLLDDEKKCVVYDIVKRPSQRKSLNRNSVRKSATSAWIYG